MTPSPPPSPPAPQPPPTSTSASEPLAPARRLPRLEDFPETGPNALASFRQRGYARVADELIVSLPVLFIAIAVQVGLSDTTSTNPGSAGRLPLVVLAGAFAVQVLYEIAAVALFGQTVGKWLTGIRVARYSDGGRPTWAQSSLRCLLWAVPGAVALVLLGLTVVGALPVFLSAWRDVLRRAWHDTAGGTIVVRTR
jgi:uncharacterized RDD family membrane protein YckC